ncbi:MAG: hypothetical protein J6112_10390 [Clostridia bacterium]|nr:hypothetical protein [Clostridia bacterium]
MRIVDDVGGTITENPSFIGNFPHPHIGVGSLWHLKSGANGAMMTGQH